MALNKKKSRRIIVDKEEFRWTISPGSGYLIFVAEKEGVKGKKIEVYIDSEINYFWVKFPDVNDLNLKVIKPKDSASIIKQALTLDWHPEEKGKPIVFDLVSDKLIKREKLVSQKRL